MCDNFKNVQRALLFHLFLFQMIVVQNWGSDFELSTKQSADVVAFSSMLEEKLLPAIVSICLSA